MSKKPAKAAAKKPVANNKSTKSVKSKSDSLVHSSKHTDSSGTQNRDTAPQLDTCLHNVQMKHEKLTDYNSKHVYLDKENDLIEISSFAQQPYLNQNGGGGGGLFNLNKKVKIEPSQVGSAYPTAAVNQKNMRSFKEENSSFPSSLASSTISVSSTSSLSSPNSNNLLFPSSSLVTIPVAADNLNVNTSNPDQQHMFVNLTNDLLDDFHSTTSRPSFANKTIKQESGQNAAQYFYSGESTELSLASSSVQLEGGDESMFNQLEQVLSIQSNTAHLNEFECLSESVLGGEDQPKSTGEQLSSFPLSFIDANSNGIIKKEEGVETLNEHSNKRFLLS